MTRALALSGSEAERGAYLALLAAQSPAIALPTLERLVPAGSVVPAAAVAPLLQAEDPARRLRAIRVLSRVIVQSPGPAAAR